MNSTFRRSKRKALYQITEKSYFNPVHGCDHLQIITLY